MAQLLAMDTRAYPTHSRFVDLSGQQFGDVKVKRYLGRRKESIYFVCECVCGNEFAGSSTDLRRGATKSCGCHKRAPKKEKQR
ncbi:hypothetical protein C5689_06460 [Methylosinus sporium]|uniref:Uncharacterized protein n=1 Tax=Methylosinus sporium TaxID=428 RepID=A0A2U1ST02_METSR|nr:hypothetical protein C5689_06460 [Methylosinus sporium]